MTKDNATILVVEDNRTNSEILRRLLQPYEVLVATDANHALKILERERPDVILLDIMMPGMDGYELCATIKSRPALHDIPILFITARTDEESLVRAFDVGGSDYVTKPFRSKELLARVRIQIAYRRALERLRTMAVTDELTGLRNRRAFFSEGAALCERIRARDGTLGALMIDIDHFKQVNDRHGHAVGDRALRLVADELRRAVGEGYLLGRIGGEEFTILAPDRDEDEAIAFAEALRRTIAELPLVADGEPVRLTLSIGVVCRRLGELGLETLLKIADNRLFKAKHGGRNRVYPSPDTKFGGTDANPDQR
ncbi:diguanylate cyclase (GGDEF) domain-containing protein [Thioflavicoccus mobilis 8321]|uniref:diguanylate cyclase n=1 Tax=Thioflavicoccus mobilis 8321 TaxID=765912 RepID=L0GWN1_9GAMM|nr:diguanylate cyclase [Thioflavicoccus mobilis]AGA90386.1 diguanylate cyclase (GGDEF) domain-containing protein [Thioflavicoccus mobilis 8321]